MLVPMASVVLENVSKIYFDLERREIPAVSRIDLEVPDGTLLAIVGPSGSGKTTLLRLIAGLEQLTTGKISIAGRIVNDTAPEHRGVAMVFQHDALYPHLTVAENLGFGLKLRRVAQAEIEERVHDTATMLGLDSLLNRLPGSLSGGERQRVALGRAIVRRPKVFLFDEPLSQLDAPLRLQLRREIARLHRRLGATSIYVTHDQAEALALGQTIVVIHHGVPQQISNARALYQCPQNLFVAGFIGSPPMNFFPGRFVERNGALVFASEDETLILPLDHSQRNKFASQQGREVILGIRPEQIELATPCTSTPTGPCIEAVVERSEPIGADTLVHLQSGPATFAARARSNAEPPEGEKVTAQFEITSAHFFDARTQVKLG